MSIHGDFKLSGPSGNEADIQADMYVRNTSTPNPTILFTPGLVIKAYLDDYPTTHVGALGSSTNPWSTIYYDNLIKGSDSRLKENVVNMNQSLEKIRLLRPVKYDYITPDIPETPELLKYYTEENMKNRAGFLAQEVKEIIPTAVKYDSISDIYGIDYIFMIPYLVGAIQEQQTQIETLQSVITAQEQDINDIKKYIGLIDDGSKKSGSSTTSTETPKLYQNSPNPFYTETQIEVFLPEEFTDAKLYVHDLSGVEVLVKELGGTGNLNITIDGSTLHKGMYIYSLIVEGELVDSKRMILTD
jgi:hypothetical protein